MHKQICNKQSGISFSLKRLEDNKMLYSCKENSTLDDRIRLLINSSISKFLINLENVNDEDLGLVKCEGIITNLSYCNESTQFKKTSISTNKMMVFFINNRLIDCEVLRKNIIQTYNAFLPKTASSPFVYLSLFIKPENVDVNVHPTKRKYISSMMKRYVNSYATKLQVFCNHKMYREHFRITPN